MNTDPDPAQFPALSDFLLHIDSDGTPKEIYDAYAKGIFEWHCQWDRPFPAQFQLEVLRYMREHLGAENDVKDFIDEKVASYK